ncbi:MAG: biotin/lipoyl-binding protein [Deltaproteobacteria bacterium]|nr:MAG: biotin/lipoyl-binding protein [Deltaproteobacteria bacterium]
MELLITLEGTTTAVEVTPVDEGRYRIALEGAEPIEVEAEELSRGEWSLRVQQERAVVGALASRGEVAVQVAGRGMAGTALDARRAALRLGGAGGLGDVSTQMPGVVVRLLCTEGAEVVEGQPVIVVEAMKMENELKAPVSGVVRAIHVTSGQAVESGALLIHIEPSS